MSGIINLLHLFNINHFSSLCCAKNSAWSAAPKPGEEDARTKWRWQGCGKIKANGDEPGRHCFDKFFICEQSDCVEKPGDTQSLMLTDSNPDAASSSQGWQKDPQLDVCTEKLVATCKDQESLNYPGIVCTGKFVGKFKRLGNRRQNLATSFPCVTKLCTSHGESLLDCKTNLRSKSDRWSEWPRCEYSGVGFLHVLLFKLQFILGKIIREICGLPRINHWSLWDSCFKRLRGGSKNRQKLPDCPRLTGSSLCGEKHL